MNATSTLTQGRRYDAASLIRTGWTDGDGTGHAGYNSADYFDAECRYLGADTHGIEPIFSDESVIEYVDADTTTELCNATPEQWDRFEAAANASGHIGGKSAANDGNLWSLTVAEAIASVTAKESDYRIAFVDGSTGDFDCVESFTAADDDAANAYATEKYAGREWYVLNAQGENINGDNDNG